MAKLKSNQGINICDRSVVPSARHWGDKTTGVSFISLQTFLPIGFKYIKFYIIYPFIEKYIHEHYCIGIWKHTNFQPRYEIQLLQK